LHIQAQELCIVLQKAFDIHCSRQEVILAFFQGLQIGAANLGCFLDLGQGQALRFTGLAQEFA
jgi:hypothetical protein